MKRFLVIARAFELPPAKKISQQSLRLIVFLLFSALALQSVLEAGALRTALRTSAETQTDVILLANLLPQNAGAAIRTVAAKVSLGTSPRTGAVRILYRDAIAAAIAGAGFQADSFEIPDTITVSRSGHFFSREEIFEAIQSSSLTQSFPQLAALRPADLHFDASIRVPATETTLSIAKISYDPLISIFRLQIQPRSSPPSLPFYATAVAKAPRNAAAHSSPASTAGSFRPTANSTLVALVEPSQLARLHLHSRDFDTVLSVRPLQRGHLDELIRVRLPGSGKTLRAHVVGPGMLDELL